MKKETTKKAPKAIKKAKKADTEEAKVLEAVIYDQSGKNVDTVKLPENIFGLPWNADLIHQVVVSLMSNKRTNLAHTKTRSEVSGGGKKPWQQKGLGRARHGSTRSPIWVKGGVAHGPRKEKNFDRKVNRKMKAKALFAILSKKFSDGEVFFLNNLNVSVPKAKEGLAILKNISKIKGGEQILSKKANSTYLTVLKKDENLDRSFRNFNNLKIDEWRNINPLDVLNYKHLIIANPAEAFKFLEAKMK